MRSAGPTPSLALRTGRLELVPSTARSGWAEASRAELARELHALVPPSWPPAAMAGALVAWRAELACCPELSGWTSWYWLLTAGQPVPVLVGCGGFKGRPDPQGGVEIGYGVVPEHRRRGYAREAVGALSAWALRPGQARFVDAETGPSNAASVGLLRRLGFRPLPTIDPATLRFRLEAGPPEARRVP